MSSFFKFSFPNPNCVASAAVYNRVNLNVNKAEDKKCNKDRMEDNGDEAEEEGEEALMLRHLFLRCDEHRTGAVDASLLVDTIRGMVDPKHPISKWSLQDLSRMLDPKLDNQKVGMEDFVRVGVAWVAKVKLAEQREQENLRRTTPVKRNTAPSGQMLPPPPPPPLRTGPRRRPPQKSWKPRHVRSNSLGGFGDLELDSEALSATPAMAEDTAESSFGLLEAQEVLESTFGSLEGLGVGPEERLSVSADMTELTTELDQLKKTIKRLSLEKTDLKNQYSSADDLLGQLQKENEDLRCKLKDAKASVQFQADLREKDLEEDSREGQEESKLLLVLRENARLQEELEVARGNECAAREDQRAANEAAAAADRKAEATGKDSNEIRDEFARLQAKMEEVRRELDATREANLSLRHEVERVNGDLSMKEEQLREAKLGVTGAEGGEMEVSHDLLDLSASGDHVWSNLNNSYFKNGGGACNSGKKEPSGGPKAVSTPFLRNVKPTRYSIGEELKELGLDVVEESPLCEKSLIKPPLARALDLVEKNDQGVQTQSDSIVKKESCPEDPFDLKFMFWTLLIVSTGLFMFTFCGAFESGSKTYFPSTWTSSLGLPEPIRAFKVHDGRDPLVW